MNNEEKILTLLYQIISEQGKMNQRLDQLENDVKLIKDAVVRMDDDHGKKLTALFDSLLINYEILR